VADDPEKIRPTEEHVAFLNVGEEIVFLWIAHRFGPVDDNPMILQNLYVAIKLLFLELLESPEMHPPSSSLHISCTLQSPIQAAIS